MEDPRKPIVEVMARLGRETQLHLDERHRHFRVTDKVIFGISIFMAIIAVFNVYYVWVLSADMDGIVNNMESMHEQIVKVDGEMTLIAASIERYDSHIAYMNNITNNVGTMTAVMPIVRVSMDGMTDDMQAIEQNMRNMSDNMTGMSVQIDQMRHGMGGMGNSVRHISRPMGFMNNFMP